MNLYVSKPVVVARFGSHE